MVSILYYVAVKASLYDRDCCVFGLSSDEQSALNKKFNAFPPREVVNGFNIQAPALQIVNALSELGYRVVCCSGESQLTWTLARDI